ncbi:FxLYD domain-containing protein [Streptomyces poriticola]|uniref:FxLYD domain-containing protein n=1 Tax=Streptomyces poriticola TaxID=3120506 RepID=UPI002FCE33DD
MAAHRARRAAGAVLVLVLTTAVAGCGDDEESEPPPSAAESAASRAASAAASLASEGADVVASATAEASRWLEEITEGVDVRQDITLGDPERDGDGRTTVEVTARNTSDSARSFAVQVDFTDQDGNLLDTAVVTVDDVAAGESARATARSNLDLAGEVRAEVARAVRY